jgi:site-specific recombinase XerD
MMLSKSTGGRKKSQSPNHPYYGHYYVVFNDWFRAEGHTDLREIRSRDLRKSIVFSRRYCDEKSNTLSKKTQSYHIIALRSWFKWLIKMMKKSCNQRN